MVEKPPSPEATLSDILRYCCLRYIFDLAGLMLLHVMSARVQIRRDFITSNVNEPFFEEVLTAV